MPLELSSQERMYYEKSPYGDDGSEAGGNVLGLLDNLLAPKTPMPFGHGEMPRLDDMDKEALGYVIALDSDMRCIDPHFDPSGGGTGLTHEAWQPLTASLPFREGERYWLMGLLRKHRRQNLEAWGEIPDNLLVTAEATVVSAGVHHTVQGRDLVRRWASWRREAHEYTDQGNLTRAIFLLDHLAYELVPRMFTRPDFAEQYPHVAAFDARTHSAEPA